MLYLIDEARTGTEESLAMYRVALPWAAARGEAAEFVVHADVYDGRELLDALLALATGPGEPMPRAPDEIRYPALPDARFVSLMVDERPPWRAPGELSPCVDVSIIARGERIYGCLDYGRVQVLELDDDGLADLRCAFASAGLDPARIISAEPFRVG
jgi:hypothetical protein